jgi:hypothetical protein
MVAQPTLRVVATTAIVVVVAAALAACEAGVTPSEASPFTVVTVDDGGACGSGDTATARSAAFRESTVLRRADGTMRGRATVADVPPGRYTIRVECESGSVTRSTLEVNSMPGASATGAGGSGPNMLRLAAGIVVAAGLALLTIGVIRRTNARTGR